MPDINEALSSNRAAVNNLAAAAVARVMEESADVVSGAPSSFPTFPAFLRPLVRGLFFNRVLKKGAFPKAKSSKAMDPDEGPATPAQARVRLEGAPITRWVQR